MKRNEGGALMRVLLMATVLVSLSACAAWAEGDTPVGYRVEGSEVVFEFDAAEYESVSRGDTGDRIPTGQVLLSSSSTVAVAGEFNGWSTDAWVMACWKPGAYELRRPLAEFADRPYWAFKFVIDGNLWVEPPASAPNVVPTGLGNDSHNLVLVASEPPPLPAPIESALLESLLLPAEALSGPCALKPLDSAVGAAPIPVASNPMITGDRRVVGFVSVFVMPPTAEEEASWETEAANEEPGEFTKRVEQLMEQRTANVRAALVAVYQGATGAETGVFALEFIEPISPERQAELAVEGPGGAVLTTEHVAAALWTDDRDASCLDDLRSHVEEALAE
jgi:hypothetical protein